NVAPVWRQSAIPTQTAARADRDRRSTAGERPEKQLSWRGRIQKVVAVGRPRPRNAGNIDKDCLFRTPVSILHVDPPASTERESAAVGGPHWSAKNANNAAASDSRHDP